jgi:hypothetical protein
MRSLLWLLGLAACSDALTGDWLLCDAERLNESVTAISERCAQLGDGFRLEADDTLIFLDSDADQICSFSPLPDQRGMWPFMYRVEGANIELPLIHNENEFGTFSFVFRGPDHLELFEGADSVREGERGELYQRGDPTSVTECQESCAGVDCGANGRCEDGACVCNANFSGPRCENVATTTYTRIATGWFHTCGLKSDGTIGCWGRNTFGESTPPAGAFMSVSAGGTHSCGLREDRTLACWGTNDFGETLPPSGTFEAVSSGGKHNCAIDQNDELVCWGWNEYGQATPPAGEFTAVSCGRFTSCAISIEGEVLCWGNDQFGQLAAPAGSFSAVSVGSEHGCALRADGTVACWGSDAQGQARPPEGTFKTISAATGGQHTCGVRAGDSILCFGLNDQGQVSPPSGSFSSVAAGGSHSCALGLDGRAVCFGANAEGQASPP